MLNVDILFLPQIHGSIVLSGSRSQLICYLKRLFNREIIKSVSAPGSRQAKNKQSKMRWIRTDL